MALSDSEREQNKKRPGRSVTAETNKRWSDKQKMEAITTYLTLGNLAMTSRLTGIPEITLRVWKASEWWKTVVDDLKSQERIELSNRMKRIVEAAHQVVENRLLNGDPVLNQKTGEIIMKPVSMKDAHRVAVDLHNQRDTIERVNAPVADRESSNEATLKQLAEKFASFAVQKIEQQQRPVQVTDVIFVEEKTSAIHDQRETRLQEGVGLGAQDPSSTSETTSGEEQSPEYGSSEGAGA